MAKKRRKLARYRRTEAERAEAAERAERLPADVSRHNVLKSSYRGPKSFYVDVEFTCRDCGTVEALVDRPAPPEIAAGMAPIAPLVSQFRDVRRQVAGFGSGVGNPGPSPDVSLA